MPNIVNVSVTQQVASAPSTLQRTGAIVSQGGTTLASGTTQLLTSVSGLNSILSGAITLSAMTWSANVVSATTATPHGIPNGQVVSAIITGVTPSGYNGTYQITSTGANTFTYALSVNPGSSTVQGAVTLSDVSELVAQVTTYFAQGTGNAVYVLELGTGSPAAGVTALEAYIANPTVKFYSYLLPAQWDVETTAPTMARLYVSTTSELYFYVTTTTATYTNWTGIKSVFATLQTPTAPVTEFDAAAMFAITLAYNPGSTNLASPLEYTFLYGVTPYSTLTSAQQISLSAAGVNWVGTGAQGQISNTLIQTGSYMDLNPFNYWYCVDWLSINVAIALSAAIINGSNTPTNPLYYNQAGINTLQKVAQATVNNGISFGLILSPATVNAVSFQTYITQNPSNYAAGIYNGLSCTFVPLRGFTSITIYLTASNIPV